MIETCQDVLQIKSSLLASKEILESKNIDLPLMVSITMETTGTMLVGSDIASALTILEHVSYTHLTLPTNREV